MSVVIGVDIGTSSSKGVLVRTDGTVLHTAHRGHAPEQPAPGRVEMAMELWWEEFRSISLELVAHAPEPVAAVGVSGMGPCVGLADRAGRPLRNAILYGVDSRATRQIAAMTAEFGAERILQQCGSPLSTQSVGPKLRWVQETEPEVFDRSRRVFMPASWLGWQLTGQYVLDHQSASQSTPLYDLDAQQWAADWAVDIVGAIELPRLVWADDVIGAVTAEAATSTGLPKGIPVVSGTIDAWTEAVSVGAHDPGDLMLMYGTTMFLINTVTERLRVPNLWNTMGAFPGTRNIAAGMATSGAITAWLRDLFGGPAFPALLAEAAASPAGARGLLMLPYFAGERTPIADPDARGLIAGLTTGHTRGDLYRAALEATAMGVRHNTSAMLAGGSTITRSVAVGGGVQGDLWAQIVSNVTGREQQLNRVTIGASFGAAFLAAGALGGPEIDAWNPVLRTIDPDEAVGPVYDDLYRHYLAAYRDTAELSHALAARQR